MVETTLRTVHGRSLLRPTRATSRTIAGVIARAQALHGMEIHAVVAMGNHLHLLLSPRDAEQLARFMQHVASNVARKVGELVGWREKFWGRRYRAIVISDEESAHIARLRYLLAHGAKEGFVFDPIDWPGLNATKALTDGSMQIEGTWFNATAVYRDRVKGLRKPREHYDEKQVMHLAPLPCWRGLPPEQMRQNVNELLDDIRSEVREQHAAAGTAPVGFAGMLAQHPHEAARRPKRSPAPAFHAATRAARQQLKRAYARFLAAYREASIRLRQGEASVTFPSGCFPPAGPFVPA